MITVSDLTLTFGNRTLFKDVDLQFLPGNCYGLIGPNGAGKTTFLGILSGEIEPSRGEVHFGKGERMAVLQQDQFAFDDYSPLHTVIMGHERLYEVLLAREEIYAKPDFSEEDGLIAADLEAEFAELNGYEAEFEASALLTNLGIEEEKHGRVMRDLEAGEKVRVLLAQALFGNPDILLLDEPTNNLDLQSIAWLENFLADFQNTVIVVSHDRHFLNSVCTHIADLDFGQIKIYTGNYDFWYEVNQIMQKQMKDQNKKREDKIAELQRFVQRFSSNASKARQATSRKKLIDKLSVDEIPVSSRKFPYVDFKPERPCGDVILEIHGVQKNLDGQPLIRNFDLVINSGDKIAFIGHNDLAKTTIFDLLMNEQKPDSGQIRWGITIKPAYLPKESSAYFDSELNLVEWILQYAPADEGEQFARGWLGRMLFSGDEALKKANVLSGGEKVRCMLARIMFSGANVLVLDEPTNHLDLEAIMALNDGLERFPEVVLFASHDYELVRTVANRIVEMTPHGTLDRMMTLEEYANDERVQAQRREWGLTPLAI